MKIFTVALVIFLIKGSQSAAIPVDESKPNISLSWQQPFWELFKIGHEFATAAVGILSKSELAKTAVGKLANSTEKFDTLLETTIKELYNLTKELEWKGVPITQHIIEQGKQLQDKLYAAGSQVQEAIGNETYNTIQEKLELIHNDIQQYRQNLSQISSQFNQTIKDTTQQVEEWHKRVSLYTEPLREKISGRIDELRKYLSPFIHETKEKLKTFDNLVAKWKEAPSATN
ncbi:apolipoprotein A-IV-like [Narcine bancroftii]|uniref:apolipoprotein A-IV-like n=1 Tax=Narcine bancroftii TaxID=1343680 RepID=UPI003831ABF4